MRGVRFWGITVDLLLKIALSPLVTSALSALASALCGWLFSLRTVSGVDNTRTFIQRHTRHGCPFASLSSNSHVLT